MTMILLDVSIMGAQRCRDSTHYVCDKKERERGREVKGGKGGCDRDTSREAEEVILHSLNFKARLSTWVNIPAGAAHHWTDRILFVKARV